MKKPLLERFQQLAGIKPLHIHEQEESEGYVSTKKLFDNIIRGLETSGPYQDNPMLTKEEALLIMDQAIAIEESDISPEAALGEFEACNWDVDCNNNEKETDV